MHTHDAKSDVSPEQIHVGGALEAAYKAHAQELSIYIHQHINDASDVRDILHDTFAVASAKFAMIECGKMRPFLYRVARNLTWNKNKTAGGRKTHASDKVDDFAQTHSNPELKSGRAMLVRHTLSQLSTAHSEVILMHDLNGMTRLEIAEVIGIPANTVGSRLRKARVAFKKHWHAHVELQANNERHEPEVNHGER